jgi:hypothetical protein
MSLPIIKQKFHSTKIISTGKVIKFRPFTVGEQKQVMLVKSTGGGDMDVYFAVVDMIQECVTGVNVKELKVPDFEKLFYDIRAVSDGNKIEIVLECPEEGCKHENTFEVDVNEDMELSNKDNFIKVITVTENETPMSFEIGQPSIKITSEIEKRDYESEEEKVFDILSRCVTKVNYGDEVYNDFTPKEASEFLDQLPGQYFNEIEKFFKKSPDIVMTKEIKCQNEKCEHIMVEKGGSAKAFLS